MIPFETTPDQMIEVYKLAGPLADTGVGNEFVANAIKLACEYEGAYELLLLWKTAKTQEEKDEILADLQEEIDRLSEAHTHPFKAAKINFAELDRSVESVIEYKKALKQLIDQWGGISKLAKVTEIPQPSLSRFFSSASLPRSTTIQKIADALLNARPNAWSPPISVDQIRTAMGMKDDSKVGKHT